MKTLPTLLRLAAASAAFFGLTLILSAADAKKPDAPAELQVLVNVPPTWRPFLEDDIADALTYRLTETFRRRGYAAKIAQVTPRDPAGKDIPLIEIFLTEWRIDRIGNAQCTFTATLRTKDGEKDLGFKNGTALFMASGSRWGMNRQWETAGALEDAASNAMRELYDAVAKTGQIPGLAPKK